MNQHERRRRVPRVAQHVLEVQHVHAAQIEVVAAADRRVDVHRQPQPAGLRDNVSEDEILKRLVFVGRRHAAAAVLVVDRRGRLARRIVERQRSEVRGLELHRCAAARLVRSERA